MTPLPLSAAFLITALVITPATQPAGSNKPRELPNGSIPVVVSKETTKFTEPLNPDGTVNYVEALDALARKGVTKDNNLFVAVLQACGPDIVEDIRKQMLKRLDLDIPEKGDYFKLWKQAGLDEGNINDTLLRPWQEKDHPTVAKWLANNRKPLDELVAATARCTHFYIPLIDTNNPPRMMWIRVPALGRIKNAALALTYRSMLRFAQGNFEGARSDLNAVGRMGRLVSNGPMVISWLVGIACENMVHLGYEAMAGSGRLTAAQARALISDIQHWPDRTESAAAIDMYERAAALDVVMMLQRGEKLAPILRLLVDVGDNKPQADRFWMMAQVIIADFNPVVADLNAGYDALITGFRKKTFRERVEAGQAVDQAVRNLAASSARKEYAAEEFWNKYKNAGKEDKRQMMTTGLTKILPPFLLPAITSVSTAETRIGMRQDLTRLSLSLAACHADNAEYPEKLDALVPKYLGAIPADLFIDQPLHYKREGRGYLLYSVGADMKDNGGQERKTDGLDEEYDEVIRVNPDDKPSTRPTDN